jgi:hypothetical protein
MLAVVGKVLLFALSAALSIAVPALIVRRDLAQLTGERLARSWPDASLWLAVVIFGPLSVPIHFIRTRRSFAGLAAGLFWFAAALAVIIVPIELLARIFGIPD